MKSNTNVPNEIDALTTVRDTIRTAVQRGDVPGAVALVHWHGKTVLHNAEGWAALEPERRPMQRDSIFDLASLTKPLLTAPLVLQLADRGVLSLDDEVRRYVPPMAHFSDGRTTIRQLLTHSSGLPAWSPLYVWASRREEVADAIARSAPAYAPDTAVVYSCLGFIALGLLIEEVTGSTLDEAASGMLLRPMNLRDTGYAHQIDRERCVSTEHGNAHEERNVRASGLHFDGWRTDYLVGSVHDGNAWYAMGGVSGNAGLFGTAHDLGLIGQMWLQHGYLGGTRVLREETALEATSDCTPQLDEGRGLGWQMHRPPNNEEARVPAPRSSGTRLGPRAFGHTGFTGTSIWIDPDLDIVAVLLTNRVHPTVDDATSVIRLRGNFHDAIVTALRDPALSPSPPER